MNNFSFGFGTGLRRNLQKATIKHYAAAAVLSASAMASASPAFYSTTTNLGQVDSNWKVAFQVGNGDKDLGLATFQNLQTSGTFGDAYAWTTYTNGSASAGTLANTIDGGNGYKGNYVYFDFRQTFDLTGYDPSSASLSFQWGCDDVSDPVPWNPAGAVPWNPVYSLNGNLTEAANTTTCGSYNLGNSVTLSSGFVSGLNVIDFFVEGNGQTDGLAVYVSSFTARANPTQGDGNVPEPTTLALISLAFAGLSVVRRSK